MVKYLDEIPIYVENDHLKWSTPHDLHKMLSRQKPFLSKAIESKYPYEWPFEMTPGYWLYYGYSLAEWNVEEKKIPIIIEGFPEGKYTFGGRQSFDIEVSKEKINLICSDFCREGEFVVYEFTYSLLKQLLHKLANYYINVLDDEDPNLLIFWNKLYNFIISRDYVRDFVPHGILKHKIGKIYDENFRCGGDIIC